MIEPTEKLASARPDGMRRALGQLREMRRSYHFTATRVGEPGCGVRLEAQDNLDAIDVAICALEIIQDPKAVHLNMLRGIIARPSAAAIKHIYGEQLNAARDDTSPTNDMNKTPLAASVEEGAG